MAPATAAAPATPTPKIVGITLPPSLEDVLAEDVPEFLSILITSKVSPVLSVIFASLSGADGVVVETLSFGVPVPVDGALELPPPV